MSLKNLKVNNKIVIILLIAITTFLILRVYPKYDYTISGAFVFPLFYSVLLFLILISIFVSRETTEYKLSKEVLFVTLNLILFCICANFFNFYYSLTATSLVNGVLFYKKNYLKIVSHSLILVAATFIICEYLLNIELP